MFFYSVPRVKGGAAPARFPPWGVKETRSALGWIPGGRSPTARRGPGFASGFDASFFKMKAVQMWSFNRCPCAMQTSATYCALFLLFLLLSGVDAVCPHCFGIFNGCTFDTNTKCPSIETVSANAKVIAAGGVGVLSLVALIRPPYLRTFTLATIELLLAIVRRPAPGTEFEVKPNTKTSANLGRPDACHLDFPWENASESFQRPNFFAARPGWYMCTDA